MIVYQYSSVPYTSSFSLDTAIKKLELSTISYFSDSEPYES